MKSYCNGSGIQKLGNLSVFSAMNQIAIGMEIKNWAALWGLVP
jgi:hypothetical protein